VKSLLFVLTVLIFIGCKKEYTCTCNNPGGTKQIFTEKSSKKDATKKCKDYYNATYGNVAWNETSCEIK
jgi:hypothetical protein